MPLHSRGPRRSVVGFSRQSVRLSISNHVTCRQTAIRLTANSKLRRAIRTRGHFPSDDAAAKLLYLVLNHAAADWKRPPREWFEAKTQFAVMFKERFVLA